MPNSTLFVSVNQSFDPHGNTFEGDTLESLKKKAAYDWRVSVATARKCSRVVAMFEGQAIGCWELIDAFHTDTPWGKTKTRTALVLGQALPVFFIDPEQPLPNMRNGVAVMD